MVAMNAFAGGGAPPGGSDEDQHRALVAAVKDLQKGDRAAREQWLAFTDAHGGGTRDPSKHGSEFLQNFIMQYNSGQRMPVSAGDGVVDVFKLTQKKNLAFKAMWSTYCVQFGRGLMDPSKHDTVFHSSFLAFMSEQVLNPPNPGGNGDDPFGNKRQRTGDFGAVPGMDPLQQVVAQLEAFMRMGQQQSDLWSLYADTYLGGVRDPRNHAVETLREFCVNHNVPPLQAQFGAAMGGEPLDPEKDALVQRVKGFTKGHRDNMSLWLAFCGRTKDPARHENAKLLEFCQFHNI